MPKKPMKKTQRSPAELQAEVEELSWRLQETEQVLEAIRTGSIDAVVVSGADEEDHRRPFRHRAGAGRA